jgi:hypothetical protein
MSCGLPLDVTRCIAYCGHLSRYLESTQRADGVASAEMTAARQLVLGTHAFLLHALSLSSQTFSNQLHTGTFVEEGPTVGLNVKVVKKGGVTMKVVRVHSQRLNAA